VRSPLLESPSLVYQPSPYELYGGTHRVRAGDGELLLTWARPAPWFTPWGGATSSWAVGAQNSDVAHESPERLPEELPGDPPSWAWEVGRGLLPSELRSWGGCVASQASQVAGRLVAVVLSRRAGWSACSPREAGRRQGRPGYATQPGPVLYAAILDRASGRVLWEALGAGFSTGRPSSPAEEGWGEGPPDAVGGAPARRVRRSRWRIRW
jgi:hypothetical protein